MSQKCKKLHEILREGKKFDIDSLDDANAKKELNHHGLYIFYENGETGHGGGRIVRVGKAISHSIFSRIRKHFFGTKRHSIFRKQIGRAIIVRDYPNATNKLENWNKKDEEKGYIPDFEIEEKVSQYLADNCHFIAIAIKDIKRVEELEKKMTATVAQCNECKPSQNWLGKKSPKGKIREYGLWQEQNLDANELSKDDLDEIEIHLIKVARKN